MSKTIKKLCYDNTQKGLAHAASLVFGEMVKLAFPVLTHYHSDLYSDAIFLSGMIKSENLVSLTFYYSFNDTGTDIYTSPGYAYRNHQYRITVENNQGQVTMEWEQIS